MLKDDRCHTVRQGVCQALRFLFKEGNPHLISRLPEIMDFILAKCQDPDERVALEACEFWHAFSEYDDQHNKVGHLWIVCLCMHYVFQDKRMSSISL